jgi:hypothetical protein
MKTTKATIAALLIPFLFCLTLLRQPHQAVTSRAESVRPKQVTKLNQTVPQPNSSKYKNIIYPDDWKNPSVSYNSNNSPSIIVRIKAPFPKEFSASEGELLKVLQALPITAWPYGRVLAVHGPSGHPGFPEAPPEFNHLRKVQEDEIKKAAKALKTEIVSWPV